MNFIEQFVKSINAKNVFDIIVGNKRIFCAPCCVRFLFIEIGSPNVEGFIFMPDYTSKIDYEAKQLIFKPNKQGDPQIIFINESEHVLNSWFTFSSLSNASLENFFENIDFKMPQDYSESIGDITISLTSKFMLIVNDKMEQEFKYNITNKSCLKLSEIGESAKIGIFDIGQPSIVKWIAFPDITQLYKWFLYIKSAIYFYKNKNNVDIDDISIEISEIDNMKSNISSEFKTEEINEIINLNSICLQKQSFDVDHKRIIKEDVKNIMKKLDKKVGFISNKHIKKISEISEPTLEYPSLSSVVSKEDDENIEFSYRDNHIIDKEELNEIIRIENQKNYFNFQYYLPNFQEINLNLNFEFELNVEESIEYQYENSSEDKRCLIFSSILLNGYKKDTFSTIFEIKKDEIIKEVFNIINKYKSIKNIIEILLKQDLFSIYDYGAIIFDNVFINKLVSLNKNINIPKEIPKYLPFNFKLRPYKEILNCFYEFLYNYKMNFLDSNLFIESYTNSLYSLFSHYLIEDKNIQSFVKEIIQKMGPTSIINDWSIFRNNKDFNVLWNQFWNKSFKASKLLSNFLEFFNYPQIIESFYLPCSEMRNGKNIQNIANFLKLFENLKINKL